MAVAMAHPAPAAASLLHKNARRFFRPSLPPIAEHEPRQPPCRRILRRPVFDETEGAATECATTHVNRKPPLPQQDVMIHAQPPTTGSQARVIARLAGHNPGSPITGIALPCSSTTLFSAGQDGFLKGWDNATGLCTQLVSLGQPANCLFNSFDDPNWLFVGLATEVRVVNLAGNTQQSLLVNSPVLSLTSLGDLLLAGLEQGAILVWRFEAASAAFVSAAPLNTPAIHQNPSAVLTLEPAASTQAASKTIISGHADGTLRVWDLCSGSCTGTVQAHHGAVTQILSCGLDCMLSSSQADGKIAQWRLISDGMQTAASITNSHHPFKLLSTHIVHDAEQCLRPLAMCGLFDKNNTPMLYVSYNNSTVHIFELPSFTERGILLTEMPVKAVEIGPQNLLFLGSNIGSLTIWSWSKHK